MSKNFLRGAAKIRKTGVNSGTRIDHHFTIGSSYKCIAIHQVNPCAVVLPVVWISIVNPFSDIGGKISGYIPAETTGIYNRPSVKHDFPSIVCISIPIRQEGGIAGCIRSALRGYPRIPIMIPGNVQAYPVVQKPDIRAKLSRLPVCRVNGGAKRLVRKLSAVLTGISWG
jgi:hypothetical protein